MSDAPAEQAQFMPPFSERVAKSSQVAYCNYYSKTQELVVIFRSSQQWRYTYSDFPPDKWEELHAAPSVGSYLYRNVTRPLPGASAPPYVFRKEAVPPGELPAQPAD